MLFLLADENLFKITGIKKTNSIKSRRISKELKFQELAVRIGMTKVRTHYSTQYQQNYKIYQCAKKYSSMNSYSMREIFCSGESETRTNA